MTPIDYMTSGGRRPSFGRVGGRDGGFTVTSLRSRPGAPLAEPKEGLDTGSNATSASSWVNTFRNTGQAVQRQAITERLQMPGMSGTDIFRGISQPIVNEFMPQTPSAQSQNASLGMRASATGMLANPWSAPFGAAMMGGFQSPNATAPISTAFDQGTASMMRNWLRERAPVRSQWQSGTMAQQDTSPRTVMRSMPTRRPGDYAYATFPNWNQSFLRNG